jgi:hypothetical protein
MNRLELARRDDPRWQSAIDLLDGNGANQATLLDQLANSQLGVSRQFVLH